MVLYIVDIPQPKTMVFSHLAKAMQGKCKLSISLHDWLVFLAASSLLQPSLFSTTRIRLAYVCAPRCSLLDTRAQLTMCAGRRSSRCMDYCLVSALCNNARSLVSLVIWQPRCITGHSHFLHNPSHLYFSHLHLYVFQMFQKIGH